MNGSTSNAAASNALTLQKYFRFVSLVREEGKKIPNRPATNQPPQPGWSLASFQPKRAASTKPLLSTLPPILHRSNEGCVDTKCCKKTDYSKAEMLSFWLGVKVLPGARLPQGQVAWGACLKRHCWAFTAGLRLQSPSPCASSQGKVPLLVPSNVPRGACFLKAAVALASSRAPERPGWKRNCTEKQETSAPQWISPVN